MCQISRAHCAVAVEILLAIKRDPTSGVKFFSAFLFIASYAIHVISVSWDAWPFAISIATSSHIAKVYGTLVCKPIFFSHTFSDTFFANTENARAWCAETSTCIHQIIQIVFYTEPNILISNTATWTRQNSPWRRSSRLRPYFFFCFFFIYTRATVIF